jgi:hypothetical protein
MRLCKLAICISFFALWALFELSLTSFWVLWVPLGAEKMLRMLRPGRCMIMRLCGLAI